MKATRTTQANETEALYTIQTGIGSA